MTAIQRKIEKLTKNQQKEVLLFIDDVMAGEKVDQNPKFDVQIEKNIREGKLEKLAARAKKDFVNNRFKSL